MLVALAGCEDEPPAKHPVAARAPFDLDCPQKELNFDKLDDNTLGVSGCGRRATYVRICREQAFGEEECKWLMNNDSR